MQRNILLFLISLLIAITSSSQIISNDTVIITTQQLKQTNLIFLEHQKLTNEVQQLYKKVELQQDMINNYIEIDSLRVAEISKYKSDIDDLNRQMKKNNKKSLVKGILFGSAIGISLTALIFLVK